MRKNVAGFLLATLALVGGGLSSSGAAQSQWIRQKSERDMVPGIDFFIARNARVILGPHHLRSITVFVPSKAFTLENIRTIFMHLSENYPAEDFLRIDAVSNSSQLREKEFWFAAIESFPFGDVAPRRDTSRMETPSLSAQYYRSVPEESCIYSPDTGESIRVELRRSSYGCEDPDDSTLDLVGASILGCNEVVKRLLDSGADTNVKGRHGGSAVFEAAYWGHEQILQLLLDRGADVNQTSASGWTALIGAIGGNRSRSIIELLLTRGADINVRTEEGRTALIHAVIKQDAPIVGMLLARGADVTIRDGYGRTALAIAEESHDEDLIRLLKGTASR